MSQTKLLKTTILTPKGRHDNMYSPFARIENTNPKRDCVTLQNALAT